jgi:hypothetical protein
MEIFKANAYMRKTKYKLINILKDKQITYPVSFVVRKEDTVLRNFLNLRIIALYNKTKATRDTDGKIKEGEEKNLLDIIEDEIVKFGFEKDDAKDIFIHDYDFSTLE